MTRFRIGLALLGFALVCCPAALANQVIPLEHWAAPPYWSPPATAPESALPTSLAKRTALASSTPLPFVGIAPCRQYDSRNSTVLLQDTPRTVPLVGAPCGIPAAAQAAALNITIFNITGAVSNGVFKVDTVSPPVTAWINYPPTEAQRGNAGVVGLTVAGGIVVQVNQVAGFVDFVVDVYGYYAPQGIVNSLNTLNGDVTLSAGTNVTITPTGNTLTIASTAGGGPPSGPAGGGLSGTYPNPTVVSTNKNIGGTIVSRDVAGGFDAGSLTLSGNLSLPSLSLPAAGMVILNGAPFLHAFGIENTFAGQDAGNTSMTGSFNSAFGTMALHSNAPGAANSALGYWALASNTSGGGNSASGESALRGNTAGSGNSAFGAEALFNNTTSGRNTAVGQFALFSQSFDNSGISWDSDNTAIGAYALANNMSTSTFNGILNTAVGSFSLLYNSTGSQNTAVGHRAGGRTGAGTGYGGGSITFVANTIGTYNTFVGYGTGATADVFNCTTVGIDAYCDGNNQVRLGNAFVGSIGGSVGWSALSDARAKKEIRDLALGLEFVLKLRPVEYKLKTGNERTDMGFLAQDLEALLGEDYNVLTVGGDSDRTLSLRYTDLIAPLVKAVQQQQAMLLKDRDEIRALQARLRQLESLLPASNRRPDTR